MKGRVLLTAPPGGHAGYAIGIAHYLVKAGVEVAFLAPRGAGWLRSRLERLGPVIDFPVPRRPGEPLWKTLHRWPPAFLRALRRVGGFRAVVATGSNASIPPAVAGRLRGLLVYNLESIGRIVDASKATRLLYRLRVANVTLLHWEEQRRHYPEGVVVGPVYEPPTAEPRDEGYVLVTAGTLGNRELFEAVLDTSWKRVIVQTGAVDPEPLARRRPEWRFLRYTDRFDELLAGASLVVAQFPALTPVIARLAYGKPTVMVPARHLKSSSSLENAPIIAEKIRAVYVEEVTGESIEEAARLARRLPQPRLPVGARVAAEIIAGEVDA